MTDLLQVIDDAFSGQGFFFRICEIEKNMHRNRELRFALASIKKAEMSKLVNGRGNYIGQEIRLTAAVRCYDTEREFGEIDTLETMVGQAMQELLSLSTVNVRWLSTGEIEKDISVGRYCMTVLIELAAYNETPAAEEDENDN